jgi:hypothetical protein
MPSTEVVVKLTLLSLGFPLFTFGCATAVGTTSEDAGTTQTADAAAKDSGKKTLPEAGNPPPDDSGTSNDDSSVPLTDSTCSGESTKAQCEQCCLKVHPGGYNTYYQALQSCACLSPGPCASACSTELCASQPSTTGDACDTCVNGALTQSTGACYNDVAASCQSDADCTTLFSTCIPPCESK